MSVKKEWSAETMEKTEQQLRVIRRGAAEILPLEDLREKLARSIEENRPLKIKLGLDPTAPDLHIGHTVVFHKLREFQELGHQVQLVIGDFTAQIGDPTGKSQTRKQLSEEEVKENAKTYTDQLFKVLDREKTEVYFNSHWLSPLTFADVTHLASKCTVARMLERDDFSKRYERGQAISIHEFFYPLMQGYDSVVLKSDIEIGGTDQTFNLLMGRQLQKEYGLEEQVILTMPILEGMDGAKKMSKSLGNYIGVDEEPNNMYGKTMSIPDELMLKYFELVTDLTVDELDGLKQALEQEKLHPRDAKMRLAHTLVRMYHGKEAADEAQRHFQTVFQKGSLPDEIPEVILAEEDLEQGKIWVVALLSKLGLVASNGEGRRMIQQGGVRINQEKVTDIQAQIQVEDGMVVQVGKRKFAKVKRN
ncbi:MULTISPECIES: tyrosine--tRNA ligase [unclassified Thermoactinomyces]|uniref:tyrosine--tRNA ligase n=1 Tax=unclassified Thermoactinomyces TaxID=2634588 RepID=UPI0007A0968B|nr:MULTISPECIES: tyrosine--tRNA ligase [unclassified Thermoactinomyces]KYQ86628.1 tyrosine--tRNA ligase [Thermoactinomyces sp. AS95]MBI0386537.1 tyrosine--tRNA ligase [Thermoactinomyces sp. CICC 24227]